MSLDTIVIDKFAFVQTLERGGFSRVQAERLAEAVSDVALKQLTSKADLKDLELRLYKHMSGILIAHAVGTAALTAAFAQLLQ